MLPVSEWSRATYWRMDSLSGAASQMETDSLFHHSQLELRLYDPLPQPHWHFSGLMVPSVIRAATATLRSHDSLPAVSGKQIHYKHPLPLGLTIFPHALPRTDP